MTDANIEKIKYRFFRTAFISKKIQQDKHIDSLVEAGIKDVYSKYPDGTILTSDIINEISDSVARKLTPYYIGFIRKKLI